MLAFTIFFVFSIAAYLKLQSTRNRTRRLPPGPPPEPVIGNLRHVPGSHSWLFHAKMKEVYRDVIHYSFLGKSVIILNSAKAAVDLLEKRANIYSDRPTMVMIGEMMGLANGLIWAHYGDEWKTQRLLFHKHFSRKSVKQFWDLIEIETRAYVLRLHRSQPPDFTQDFSLTAIKLMMGATYGLPVNSLEDDYVTLAIEVNDLTGKIASPGGGYLVEILPALRYLPSWFPGSEWKRTGKEWSHIAKRMISLPWENTKASLAQGKAVPSFAASLMEDPLADAHSQEERLKWLSGMMYVAGAETMKSAVSSFLLALLRNPQVQKKIQSEIDDVVGSERLPGIPDKDNLPYVDAVIKEVLRWNLAAPMGLPHRVLEDDEYEGYLIPEGATIAVNIWAIGRDPETYTDPEEFRPERFLSSDPPLDPRSFVFGRGKRSCPGNYFAELVLYMVIVSLASSSSITRALDEDGNEIIPLVEYGGKLISEPEPFPCRIISRFSGGMDLLVHAIDG